MAMDRSNKQKIRQHALLEAIKFCGGVRVFSERLKINRTRVSNWCNKPEISIPYEYAVLAESMTGVSIERLSPFTESINKALRGSPGLSRLIPTLVSLDDIIIDNYPYTRYINPDRSIIIGTDKVLISGLKQLESLKISKLKKATVLVLDPSSLLLGIKTLKDFNFSFLISEQVLMGLRLEQLISNCSDSSKKSPCILMFKTKEGPYRKCNEVSGRYLKEIAHMVGFENEMDYAQAKMVYFKGSPSIIQRVDQNQISLPDAAKIVCMPEKF